MKKNQPLIIVSAQRSLIRYLSMILGLGALAGLSYPAYLFYQQAGRGLSEGIVMAVFSFIILVVALFGMGRRMVKFDRQSGTITTFLQTTGLSFFKKQYPFVRFKNVRVVDEWNHRDGLEDSANFEPVVNHVVYVTNENEKQRIHAIDYKNERLDYLEVFRSLDGQKAMEVGDKIAEFTSWPL